MKLQETLVHIYSKLHYLFQISYQDDLIELNRIEQITQHKNSDNKIVKGIIVKELSLPGKFTNYYKVKGEWQFMVHKASEQCFD